jgi:hypothetical protein
MRVTTRHGIMLAQVYDLFSRTQADYERGVPPVRKLASTAQARHDTRVKFRKYLIPSMLTNNRTLWNFVFGALLNKLYNQASKNL